MDIIGVGTFETVALDHIARQIIGRGTSGISVGAGLARIHLINDSASNQRRASDILNHFERLRMLDDVISAREGQAAPVIRCRDLAIAKDTEIAYLVLLAGQVQAQGLQSVVSGELSFTIERPTAGSYRVFVYRTRGNYASGSVQIVVQAA